MNTKYINAWNQQFNQPDSAKSDLIASISETAINSYLESHRKWDKDRYFISVKIPVEHSGSSSRMLESKFVIGSKNDPIKINLAGGKAKKSDIIYQNSLLDYNSLLAFNNPPNVEVTLNNVLISMKWPMRNNQGNWDHSFGPFTVTAKANIDIAKLDGRFSLVILPSELSISKPANLKKQIKKSIERNVLKSQQSNECQEKFDDLIIVLVNYLGEVLAPKLIKNIEIPVFEIKGKSLSVNHLAISNDMVSLGAGMDVSQFYSEVNNNLNKKVDHVWDALQKDVEDNGGIFSVFYGTKIAGLIDNASSLNEVKEILDQVNVLSEEQVDKKFKRTNTLLAMEKEISKTSTKITARGSEIKEGFAFAINESILNNIANLSLPAPRSHCSDETKLAIIRGKICSWSRVNSAEIRVNGTSLAGGVSIDFGAKLVYRLKEILNCSWRWGKEHDISISIVGRPKISLSVLERKEGLSVYAKIDLSGVNISTNLPFPLNELIKLLGKLILKFIEVVVNLVAAALTFVVFPIKLDMPQQVTDIALSEFNAFKFERNLPFLLPDQKIYLAHTASMEPVK